MFWPFPIFHIPCFSIGVLWSMIDFQIHEAWFLGLWLWRSSFGQYLALKVLDTKRLGLLQILQYCLEIMDWFINPNFLWFGDCVPVSEVEFLLTRIMTPPECIDDGVQFFADGFWGFEKQRRNIWGWSLGQNLWERIYQLEIIILLSIPEAWKRFWWWDPGRPLFFSLEV